MQPLCVERVRGVEPLLHGLEGRRYALYVPASHSSCIQIVKEQVPATVSTGKEIGSVILSPETPETGRIRCLDQFAAIGIGPEIGARADGRPRNGRLLGEQCMY